MIGGFDITADGFSALTTGLILRLKFEDGSVRLTVVRNLSVTGLAAGGHDRESNA